MGYTQHVTTIAQSNINVHYINGIPVTPSHNPPLPLPNPTPSFEAAQMQEYMCTVMYVYVAATFLQKRSMVFNSQYYNVIVMVMFYVNA